MNHAQYLSEKRAYMRGYRLTERYKQVSRAHDKTPKRIAAKREAKRKYDGTLKAKETLARYRKTPKYLAYRRDYDRRPKRRSYHNQQSAKQRSTNLNYRIRTTLRDRLAKAIRRNGGIKSRKTIELLGCSIESFKIYLESKFEVGMSWKNYGTRGWHIDHIMPCAIFDLTKFEHQKRCFHFSNMQPLWRLDNQRKGTKAPELFIDGEK